MYKIEQFEVDGAVISAEIKSDKVLTEAGKDFKQQLDVMVPVVKAAKDKIDTLEGLKPSEVSIEFGISFGAEAGVLVAKASVDASITVSLTWTLD